MGAKGDNNRQRIVEAADQLFYQRGYNQTSFRDISDVAGVPRGNFYYYFRSKGEILGAVVDCRMSQVRDFIDNCTATQPDPRARLLAFTETFETNKDRVIEYGCPVGTLCTELAKEDDHLRQASLAVFEVLRDWLAQQFSELGFEDAVDRAMDMLARMQGISVLSCAFKDAEFLQRSHNELKTWVNKQTLS